MDPLTRTPRWGDRRPLQRTLLALLAPLVIAGCTVSLGTEPAEPPPLMPTEEERLERIDLSHTQVQLRRGYTVGVGVTGVLRGGGRRVIAGDRVGWWSSSPAIAEVTLDGLVIGRGTGSALVRATLAGRSATVEVQVLPER